MALLIFTLLFSLRSPHYIAPNSLISSFPNLPHSLFLRLCNCKRLASEIVREQEAMAIQENCARVTRAAAMKRTAVSAGLTEEKEMNKKRVVLGEISNLSNIAFSVNKIKGKVTQKKQIKGKPNRNTRVVKPALKVKKEEAEDDKLLDIDAKSDDPQMCGHYVFDIYDYLRQMEVEPKRRPLPDYIEKVQKYVSTNMRAILVDWLVEVSEEYKLVPDTLYLTISYIDRYLSLNVLNRQRLQLLGVSSMLIASKYEEINPPNVEDFCYITDNTYKKDEVVKMEADILKSLKFEFGNPTVKTFLRRFTEVAQEDYKVSSKVSILVVFVESIPWYSGYKPSDLKECVLIIHDLYLSRRGGALQAVREKYKQHTFKCVATMPASPEILDCFFEDDQEVDVSCVEDVQAVKV